jgi:hypothetical protein
MVVAWALVGTAAVAGAAGAADLVAAVGDDPTSIFNLITDGGLVAVAILLVWAFLTKRIIPGKVHEDIVANRDTQLAACSAREGEWRELALNATGLADRQQVVIERVVPAATGGSG